MSKRGKSYVWEYFIKSTSGSSVVKCKLCSKEYKSSGNTSNLMDHLKRTHSTEIAENKDGGEEKKQKIEQYFVSKKENFYDLNSAKCKRLNEKLAMFIALDCQPFSVVEDKGFRQLLNELDPRYNIPSAKYVSKTLIPNLYEQGQQKLRSMLSNKNVEYVALTTDCWSSINVQGFITVTCHFLFDFKLISAVLQTVILTESHTAVYLSEQIKKIMDDWQLNGKISAVITDNASTMVNACGLLKIRHMPCIAHTVNLLIQDAVNSDSNEEIRSIIKHCKSIVNHFKNSPKAYEKLRSIQQDQNKPTLKVIQEVSTRWNSLFLMMQRLLLINDQITLALYSSSNKAAPQPLNHDEIAVMEDMIAGLSPFFEATEQFSGDSYLTVSLVIPIIYGLHNKLKAVIHKTECGEKLIKDLQAGLIKRLGAYETRTPTGLSTLLDPRFKKPAFRLDENYKNAVSILTNELTNVLAQKKIRREQTPGPSQTKSEEHP